MTFYQSCKFREILADLTIGFHFADWKFKKNPKPNSKKKRKDINGTLSHNRAKVVLKCSSCLFPPPQPLPKYQIIACNQSPLLQTNYALLKHEGVFWHSFEFNWSYFHLTTDICRCNLFNSIIVWLYWNCSSANPSFSCQFLNKYL